LTGIHIIDDVPYIFASSGALKTGWRTYEGKRFYYDPESGERKLGLINYCGRYFYITAEDGKCSGVINIDGMDYVFCDEFGCMDLGWQIIDGHKHYYFEDATAAVGFQTIDGAKYYFNSEGVMAEGWQTIDNVRYYFLQDGKMAFGMQIIDGKTYAFDRNGKMINGWYADKGFKYYMGSDGVALTGLQAIEGSKYFFDNDGKMMTGWQIIGGSRYYFASSGKASTGVVSIDGKIYGFDSEGKMKTGWVSFNGTKYYFGADGAAVTGWQISSSSKYYFAKDGKMLTGWQTIDGKRYYFYPSSGQMAVNTVIDGYKIGADGSAVTMSAVQKRANEVIASIGTGVQTIYTYVRNNNRYSFMEQTRPLSEIETVGWSYFANYAMDNRFVVCYYFAAITDVLFRQAGYETRVVYGTGHGEGDHYWNQVKINGVWRNYDTCNGYADVDDAYLKSRNYTWKLYVNPEYK